jgi:tellurite resistance protein
MFQQLKMPVVPAAFFGMVLGLAGLGNVWRLASQAWQMPSVIGESLMLAATLVRACVVRLFVLKWIFARAQAIEEANHPIQCCFIGLAGVATMLIGLAALPYSRPVAQTLCGTGAAYTVAFGL